MHILITRPLEDGEEIAAALALRGHRSLLAPLLTPRFSDGPLLEDSGPMLDDVHAILATSANGIRAFIRRSERRDIPVFAVGPQTAAQARKCGFTDVKSADGDAKALAQAAALWAPPQSILLHVCAQEAPGTLAEILAARGFQVRSCALYAIEAAAALPQRAQLALEAGVLDAAMFFSPRSAAIFGALTHGLPTQNLTAFCISPATAQALTPKSFSRIAVADRPNQDALLALVG